MGVDAEVCGNGGDDDCDGLVDEGCTRVIAKLHALPFSIGACTAGVRNCLMDGSFLATASMRRQKCR